jgi:very-short-patch-repair endonuclease
VSPVPESGNRDARIVQGFRFGPTATPRSGVDTQRLELFALDHHGLVTRAAAGRAGMSTSAWYRALSSGRFEPIHANVARLFGSPATREQRIAAAVLAASPGAMASHRSAAHLWGVPRPDDDPIDIIVVSRTRGLALDGVIVHRPRDDKDLSPVLRKGIPTSNILRLGCDLGAVDPPGARAAVLYVVTNAIASPRALRTACDVHTRRGRPGVPAFRAALDEFIIDGKPVDSILESTMRDVGRRFGLPAMEFHARVCGYEVDFLVTGTPVVLECDGWDSHGRKRRLFERDRDRTATLVADGYVVVPFTWRRLVRDPAWVARKVHAAADRWRPTDLGVLVPGIRE